MVINIANLTEQEIDYLLNKFDVVMLTKSRRFKEGTAIMNRYKTKYIGFIDKMILKIDID